MLDVSEARQAGRTGIGPGSGGSERPQRSRRGALLAGVLLLLAITGPLVGAGAHQEAAAAAAGPTTGFEERGGASWTTLEEEAAFLAELDAASARLRITEIGRSTQGRPLRLGVVRDAGSGTAVARERVALLLCSQHGNEPAGRETCMQWLRELASTTSPALVDLLRTWTVLVVPTMNPDGRAADTRENAQGTDINRDHLTLSSPETQAVAQLITEQHPDLVMDLHEVPADNPAVNRVTFDDDVYYLWPRNLNVDPELYRLSRVLSEEFIGPGAEAAGYSADVYGQVDAADRDLLQIAGDHDEGISRNLAGLRGAVSLLIESNGTVNPSRPAELVDARAVNLRRVASQVQNVRDMLRFLGAHGDQVAAASAAARQNYVAQGRDRNVPIYFGGADNDPPAPDEVEQSPPCAYRLTDDQAGQLRRTLALLEIGTQPGDGDGVLLSMAQPSEPVIPLLVDARGARHLVEAQPVADCSIRAGTSGGAARDPATLPATAPVAAESRRLAATGAGALLPLLGALLVGAVAALRRQRPPTG